MVRGVVACAGCFVVGLGWFWLTGDRILAAFMGGIGSGIWLAEVGRGEPEWED